MCYHKEENLVFACLLGPYTENLEVVSHVMNQVSRDGPNQNPTWIFPAVSFFFSPPATAIVAKYWMTRLVFTVFPAPDSPLGSGTNKTQASDTQHTHTGWGFDIVIALRYLRNQDRLVLPVYKKNMKRKHNVYLTSESNSRT